ncbi:MAG: ATP synthase F1 subunit delta [Erysipelothrix sp.]|nr:ATP synthase F1 subunit delta [Erysipelothrix sp.]
MTDVSYRYGLALYEVAKEANKQRDYFEKLNLLDEVFKDETIQKFFKSRDVEKSYKKEVFHSIISLKDQSLKKFLDLLIDRYRLSFFHEIREVYEQALYHDENIKVAVIKSATELSEHQLTELTLALETKYQSTIDARVTVDSSLISGLIVKIEDDILDSSLKNRLDQLSRKLKKGVGQHAT